MKKTEAMNAYHTEHDCWSDVIAKLEFDKVRSAVAKYASSIPGRERILRLSPSTSAEKARLELRRVSELKRLLEEEDSVPLEGVYPISDALKKTQIEGTILASKELAQILATLRAASVCKTFLRKRREQLPSVCEIVESLSVDRVLEFNLDQAVDEEGNVKTSASKDLQAIRRSIAEKYDQLRKRLEAILGEATVQGFAQDQIITTREGRMVIPVKAEHKHKIRGFIHSESASGATVFIEPSETLDLNNDVRTLQFQEQKEVERILRELTKEVRNVSKDLALNLQILAELDSLIARAKYSIEILGAEPSVVEKGAMKLVAARHPLLIQAHGRNRTVPLDIELGGAYNTLVISGPNAGGKSVAMKCVGLLTMMTQAGLHIPAAEGSMVRVFRKIFVEIGDEQSIENDLSTFSSHLAHLKEIESEADADTLVLIDEIGSGTDPTEGSALASALLEALTQRGTPTIATTHHGSLKVFAHHTAGVSNGAMEFDQVTLQPTYRFRAGVPGSSYALEMAKRMNFNEKLLGRACDFLGEEGVRLQQLVSDLESAAQKYRSELESVQHEKARLARLVQAYESRLAAQTAELRELKRKAIEEARGIVENANAVIERSIREIRESSAAHQTIKRVKEIVQEVKHGLQQSEQGAQSQPAVTNIERGSLVRLRGGSESGEVVEISPERKFAIVLFGSVKMKVPITDLETAPRSSLRKQQIQATQPLPSGVARDLDLRGMTGEEALPLVEKFIDTALWAGLHRIDIIHGKGTGALRKKIADFLSKHPYVKSYRLGDWNEGGTGTTVVELGEET